MRILHAVSLLSRGGTERLVISLAAYQQKLGHEIIIATFTPLNLWPEESKSLDIRVFSCTKALHRLFRNPIADAVEFSKLIVSWNPNIVHSHSHWTEIICLACVKGNVKFVQHYHLEYPEWIPPGLNNYLSWMGRWQLCFSHYKLKSKLIAVSGSTFSYYHQFLPFLLKNKLEYIPNYLGIPLLIGVKEHPSKPTHLLAVGSLIPNKNHFILLNLAIELRKRFFPFSLTIVGDGTLREQLEHAILRLNLESVVTITGYQDDVVSWYDSADIFLHPSINESFGLVILEAMARGLPVIVNHASKGAKDFVENSINGYFVNFNNVAYVADLVSELGDPYLYNHLSQAAVRTASRYSLPHYWQRLSKTYGVSSRG